MIATGFPAIGPPILATNTRDYRMLLTVTEFCL
jgi:hypothetical protein